MRWGHRLGLTAALVAWLAIIAQVVLAVTWPRDDAGVPAPPAAFITSSGQPALVSPTDRLPVDVAGLGPPTPSADSSGWGTAWQVITYSTTLPHPGTVLFDRQRFGLWGLAGYVPLTSQYLTAAKGTTWSPSYEVLLGDAGPSDETKVPVTMPNGELWFSHRGLVAGQVIAARTVDRLVETRQLITTIGGPSFWHTWWPQRQAATVVMAAAPADGTQQVIFCRSTTSGAAWSCTAPIPRHPGVQLTSISRTQHLASPAVGVWIALFRDGTVWRSTDDGVSWGQVALLAAPSDPSAEHHFALACHALNQCVASVATDTGGRVYRTVDGGLSWSLMASLTEPLRVLIPLGQGVIVGLNPPASATVRAYRSADSGATWSVVAENLCGGVVSDIGLIETQWTAATDGEGTVVVAANGQRCLNVSRSYGASDRRIRDDDGRALRLGIAGEIFARLLDPGKTLQRAVASLTASGTIVAGVSGRRIKVYAFELQSASAGMTFQFRDGSGGPPLGLQWTLDAREGAIASGVTPPTYLFAASQGTPLHGAVTGTGTVRVAVSYWSDDAD